MNNIGNWEAWFYAIRNLEKDEIIAVTEAWFEVLKSRSSQPYDSFFSDNYESQFYKELDKKKWKAPPA